MQTKPKASEVYCHYCHKRKPATHFNERGCCKIKAAIDAAHAKAAAKLIQTGRSW